MECNFCKKVFSSKSNLCAHQNTAIFCLELQGKQPDEKGFNCDFCNKKYAQKKGLILHVNTCKEKVKKSQDEKQNEHVTLVKQLELEITKLKEIEKNSIKKVTDEKDSYYQEKLREKNEYITKLETKLEKFENAVVANMAATTHSLEAKAVKATQSTTNNTTLNTNITVNNVLNLSQEHVKKVLTEQLDYNVVYAGQSGLAAFVVEKMLKNQAGNLIYRCVDPSRQMFEFMDENGDTVRDMKAEKLIQSLVKGEVIKIGLEQAGKGWNTDDQKLNVQRTEVFSANVTEYANLNRNNTVFRSKVSSMTT
jgi:hypothetical protein